MRRLNRLVMMKNSTTFYFKKFGRNLVISFGLLAILLWSSCGKNEAISTEGTSYMTIINASPGLATYNIYLNSSKMNSAALPLGGTVPYAQVLSNTYDLKFTTAVNTESLLTKSIVLAENSNYSYFLIGVPGQLDLISFKDNLSVASEKASLRFINLSPDAPALDLAIKEKSNLISNQAYKQANEFLQVEPGTFDLDIKDKSTGSVKTTLNVTLVAGRYYTIIVRGMVNPSEIQQPLAAQLITNL